jgi:hypothetical protein
MSKQCNRENITVRLEAIMPVDNDGEPVGDVEQWYFEGDRPYYCGDCDEEFKYMPDVLEHLQQQAAA